MVQSSSWEANWFAASQEIPRISRNPKVHYRTHKRPPPVSILGHPNPVHIPKSYLLEIHPNIIHPSTPRSPQWSPSLRFPHQDPIHPPLLIHTHHMPSPSCMWVFVNKVFYREGLLAPRPTPKLEDHCEHFRLQKFYKLLLLITFPKLEDGSDLRYSLSFWHTANAEQH